ncbi:hypothetical protein [Catellatospora vulcania]|uniref:hypothetical protein n=1 Tax=Catellatospora vulcania TaxID=1460450 RepID=UPI0018AF8B2F|nr:hypothetical protein [Catellatospora vulcania]
MTLALLMMPLVAAADCEGPVVAATINYEQLGACNGFRRPDGAMQPAQSGHAYVVFRISTITNTTAGASDFQFDPVRLFVNSDPRAYGVGYYALGWRRPRAVEPRTVRAGTVETFNGTVTMEVPEGGPKTDAAAAAQNKSYFVSYETPAGTQGTFMAKANSSQTSWHYTNDCAEIEEYHPNP